ncbi:MAG: YceI family protein [Flavobacteriia bacterium]
METLFISSFAVLGLASFIISLKQGNRFTDFFTFLFFCLGLIFTLSGFENKETGTTLISFLILFMAIHFIVNALIHKIWLKFLAAISAFVCLIFSGQNMMFQEYPLVFDFKNILILPLFAAGFALILEYKYIFLQKYFPELKLQQAFSFFGNAFLLLISLFFGSTFGLILTASFLFAIELYINKGKQEKSHNAIVLFSIALVLFMVDKSQIELEAFLHASTLFGLLIGTGIALLIAKFYKISHDKKAKKFILLLLSLVLVFLSIYIEHVKEHLGGLSAFSGLLIAFLLQSNSRNSAFNFSFISFSFTLILFAIPALLPEETSEEQTSLTANIKDKETDEEKVEVNGKDIAEIIGDWKIDSKNSKLNFELGPKNTRTKGQFKEIKGEFKILENVKNSIIKVQLPISGFSTFNSYRDESLMSEEFFDAKKYDEITFYSDKLISKGDYYLVPGELTLKGISQKIELELKYTKKAKDERGEYVIISGKSSLDRTKHKMESDPKIGDLVEFNFEIELRK